MFTLPQASVQALFTEEMSSKLVMLALTKLPPVFFVYLGRNCRRAR